MTVWTTELSKQLGGRLNIQGVLFFLQQFFMVLKLEETGSSESYKFQAVPETCELFVSGNCFQDRSVYI